MAAGGQIFISSDLFDEIEKSDSFHSNQHLISIKVNNFI